MRPLLLGLLGLYSCLELPYTLCSTNTAEEVAGSAGYSWESFVIEDAEADIRELDVGDLDQKEEDLPESFVKFRRIRASSGVPPGSGADSLDASQAKPQICFAVIKTDKQSVGLEEVASIWNSMLANGGLEGVNLYPMAPDKIVLYITRPHMLGQVKRFVLEQKEVSYFELNQHKYYRDRRESAEAEQGAHAQNEEL
eukprot:GHVS01074554.1.p1 GENE.GHVS01074554.1~~GHVS01074554.1.p1  ORF type:complete len:197 (+),score=41.27 GHVS01074554.1:55-645(+)